MIGADRRHVLARRHAAAVREHHVAQQEVATTPPHLDRPRALAAQRGPLRQPLGLAAARDLDQAELEVLQHQIAPDLRQRHAFDPVELAPAGVGQHDPASRIGHHEGFLDRLDRLDRLGQAAIGERGQPGRRVRGGDVARHAAIADESAIGVVHRHTALDDHARPVCRVAPHMEVAERPVGPDRGQRRGIALAHLGIVEQPLGHQMALVGGRLHAEDPDDVVGDPGDAQPRGLPQPVSGGDQEVGEAGAGEPGGGLVTVAQHLHRDQAGDPLERRVFGLRQRARLPVGHAQRADRAPRHAQRHARVEADERAAPDQRVARESRVDPGVLDEEQPLLGDRMRAERVAARRLGRGHADSRLEPLPVFVDQTDQRDRSAEDVCGESGQLVKCRIRRGVQNAQLVQHCEALGFVGWSRRQHGACGNWNQVGGALG
jgi:hypothetical protein